MNKNLTVLLVSLLQHLQPVLHHHLVHQNESNHHRGGGGGWEGGELLFRDHHSGNLSTSRGPSHRNKLSK